MPQSKPMDDSAQGWSDPHELLAEILRHCHDLIGDKDAYRQYLAPLTLLRLTDSEAHLGHHDDFASAWCQDNYSELIEEAAEAALDVSLDVYVHHSGQMQLPALYNHQSAMPNSMARSALFGIGQEADRYLNRKELASWRGIHIEYTGPQLTQDDLDVWLGLLALYTPDSWGGSIEFSASEFLRRLGKTPSTYQREKLDTHLRRLATTLVDIDDGTTGVPFRLVGSYRRGGRGQEWKVWVEPLLARTMAGHAYSRIHFDQRLELTSNLGRWLHSYLASHSTKKAPHRVSLDRLYELSGSNLKRKRRFRELLRDAMSHLEDAGAVTSWDLDENDVLQVTR